jgi:DNA-binding PadR family transcriptional regulator
MDPNVYRIMVGLEEQAKAIQILLLLREKNRSKYSDIQAELKKKTGSGSSTTIQRALKLLEDLGLIRSIVRDQPRGWVDYELSPLGRRIADHLAAIIEDIKREKR